MKKLAVSVGLLAAMTTGAMAVSVGELIGKCGDDAKPIARVSAMAMP